MKRSTSIRIECDECPRAEHFKDEHCALEWAVGHIRRSHPETYKRLEHKGRLEARSQNGCGYFDGDMANGWDCAPVSFRQAWIETALKRHLDWPKENPL
jgi:hypothetical protein